MQRFKFRVPFLLVAIGLSVTLIGGCATQRSTHHSSSAVEYLYPDKKDPIIKPGIPTLRLPLRVGIAFVPAGSGYRSHSLVLTEQRKMALMKEVADHFRKYPFVKDIELIPSAYLKPRGGFTNLEQLRTMYGVDVMALISYDQVQFTDQGLLSLTYWTIVGAYIVPGEKNDTHTMLDTVIYDIASRKLLFRAPGTNTVKGQATLANLTEQLRADSESSFNAAAKDMIVNLDQQLALFKEKVKERPQEYRVVHTPEYTARGGGALDLLVLALVAGLGATFAWTRRRG